jgi:putative addiction module CopG family antidote
VAPQVDDGCCRFQDAKVNVALTKHFEELIARLISNGRYNNASEVVRAGLRSLEAEEQSLATNSFAPGSLKHLYTNADNRAERRTASSGKHW